jgi:hypothetical protein
MDSLASKYEIRLTQIAAWKREAIEKLALSLMRRATSAAEPGR